MRLSLKFWMNQKILRKHLVHISHPYFTEPPCKWVMISLEPLLRRIGISPNSKLWKWYGKIWKITLGLSVTKFVIIIKSVECLSCYFIHCFFLPIFPYTCTNNGESCHYKPSLFEFKDTHRQNPSTCIWSKFTLCE